MNNIKEKMKDYQEKKAWIDKLELEAEILLSEIQDNCNHEWIKINDYVGSSIYKCRVCHLEIYKYKKTDKNGKFIDE